MKAIVGLGNIGKEYERTRHNVGFLALDKIANYYNFDNFTLEEKFEAELSKGEIADEKIILIKPQTYMNASGRAVQKVMSFYKIEPADLIVIHDELDLELGNFKLGFGRSSAGHKGVQSIIDALSTKDFTRIRIGICPKDQNIPIEKFVLGNFNIKETEKLEAILINVPEIIQKELIL